MILLNGWILPVGGVALGKVCAQPGKQAGLAERATAKLRQKSKTFSEAVRAVDLKFSTE